MKNLVKLAFCAICIQIISLHAQIDSLIDENTLISASDPHYRMHDLLFVVYRMAARELFQNTGVLSSQIYQDLPSYDPACGELES